MLDIRYWKNSRTSKLYPILRGKLLHKTTIGGYQQGILTSGYIFPDKGQSTAATTVSSTGSMSSKGYVVLFDFKPRSNRDYISSKFSWAHFFDQKPATIALQLNRRVLSPKLNPNSSELKLGNSTMEVPYVETRYPEPIPFDAIDGFIVAMQEPSKGLIFREFIIEEINQFEKLIDEIKRTA